MPATRVPIARVNAEVSVHALDLREGAEYQELRLMGGRLHVPVFEAFWLLEVMDREGRPVRSLRQRSHSFVRNAYNHLISQLAAKNGDGGAVFGGGFINIKDTSGSVRSGALPILTGHDSNSSSTQSLDFASTGQGVLATAGTDTKGIVVGSGANPESFEDFALQSRILNGTTAGRLSYIQSEPVAISYDAGTLTLTVIHARFFNNNSGGDIAINEAAIYLIGKTGAFSTSNITWMAARDKLAATVTVPNTGQLKVTYTISLTYPA